MLWLDVSICISSILVACALDRATHGRLVVHLHSISANSIALRSERFQLSERSSLAPQIEAAVVDLRLNCDAAPYIPPGFWSKTSACFRWRKSISLSVDVPVPVASVRMLSCVTWSSFVLSVPGTVTTVFPFRRKLTSTAGPLPCHSTL